MKKKLILTLSVIFIIISLVFLLNIDTITRQGINYKVSSIKIPIYLKILNFFDRHYNYKWLVGRIISNEKTEEEKALKLFRWTYHNIKRQPDTLPVVDDHVWNIIVRGYGAEDQLSDVFTTLCNYVEIEAFLARTFHKITNEDRPVSIVNIKNKWRFFDPINGVSFINKNGEFASLADIKNGDWRADYIETPNETSHIDYSNYFENLPEIKEMGLGRSNIQSPLNRLLFQIKKWSESFS